MIVVLDNRDSFVFNLTRHFHLLGAEAVVVSSHGTSVADVERLAPQAIVISPGPCTPAEAGCSVAAVRAFRGRVPLLGVCLGHQAVAAACGGKVVRAREPVHGRQSDVHHDGINLFAGIPSPMPVGRYHSLAVEAGSLPAGLLVTARDASGTVMALSDERLRLYGVQFHPESVLTRHGFRLISNFLTLAGVPHAAGLADLLDLDVAGQAAGEDAGSAALDGPVVTF